MAAPEKYAEIARIMGAADESDTDLEAARKTSDAVMQLCDDIDLTSYLEDYGDVPSR